MRTAVASLWPCWPEHGRAWQRCWPGRHSAPGAQAPAAPPDPETMAPLQGGGGTAPRHVERRSAAALALVPLARGSSARAAPRHRTPGRGTEVLSGRRRRHGRRQRGGGRHARESPRCIFVWGRAAAPAPLRRHDGARAHARCGRCSRRRGRAREGTRGGGRGRGAAGRGRAGEVGVWPWKTKKLGQAPAGDQPARVRRPPPTAPPAPCSSALTVCWCAAGYCSTSTDTTGFCARP